VTDVETRTMPSAPALGTSRIAGTFDRLRAQDRIALMPYHTAGWPSMQISEEIILGLIEGGADLVEIGVPFSDPIADGTSVQRTSQLSLEQGTRLRDCIALVRRLRDRGATVPFLLMGYYNPIVKYGVERYVADCAEAGVDGFIVPDLPASESDLLHAACKAHHRDLIFMVTPTSTEERIAVAAERGSGFIYCVSVTGVTNARDRMSPTLGPYLAGVREKTDLPLAVGFGISRPDHVRLVAEHAEGAIVGAALINYLDSLPDDQKPAGGAQFVRYLRGEGGL
jgi:tryptophan synthase alpha chain